MGNPVLNSGFKSIFQQLALKLQTVKTKRDRGNMSRISQTSKKLKFWELFRLVFLQMFSTTYFYYLGVTQGKPLRHSAYFCLDEKWRPLHLHANQLLASRRDQSKSREKKGLWPWEHLNKALGVSLITVNFMHF